MNMLRLFNFPKSTLKPMEWARQLSTTNACRKSKNAVRDSPEPPVMPAVVGSTILQPKELPNSLNPYLGRSIGNVHNPNIAYRRLNNILMQNNVRKELRANLRYEKPAVARRRKNMERNRKLFGAMVSKKVALIMQMKQRGM
ncbi:hypothetical protein RMATCC62417_06054 [Rhizopus microsporus]|nr:hypothetical protein RMATCC62417_06054 [Rhizopus microsporus]